MTVEQFLSESSKQPTFSAEQIYAELKSKDILSPTYSKDLITVINYLQAEGARFPAEELRWLSNKITEMSDAYCAEKERQIAVSQMSAMMGKGKALPPADKGYIDYEQTENR